MIFGHSNYFIRSSVIKKGVFQHSYMGYFIELAYRNGNCIEKSKIFRLFDSALTLLVLKQILLDGNTWNYTQNTGIFLVRYDWNAMRANLKYFYCMTISLGCFWTKKQK